jgi:hypothetical protein
LWWYSCLLPPSLFLLTTNQNQNGGLHHLSYPITPIRYVI